MPKRHVRADTPSRDDQAPNQESQVAEEASADTVTDAVADTVTDAVADTRRRPRIRRVRWLVGATIACLMGLVAFAPQLAGLSFVQRRLIDYVTADLPGPIRIERLNLSWLRPIEAHRIRLQDHDGQPLATAERIRSERSLWQLIRSPQRIGVIHIDAPTLYVALRSGGSNWEDYAAEITPSQASSSHPPQVQVRLHHGKVHLRKFDGTPEPDATHTSGMEGWVDVSGAGSPLTFACQLTPAGVTDQVAGELQLQGSWMLGESTDTTITTTTTTATTKTSSTPRGAIQLNMDDLPLELSQYVTLRLGTSASVRGRASGHLKLKLLPSGVWPVDQLQGTLRFASLEIASPFVASENIELSSAKLQIQAAMEEDRFHVETCEFTSPLANVSLAGEFDVGIGSMAAADFLSIIQRQVFEFSGELDVAQLAHQMPKSLRLRDDVRLDSGMIRWKLANELNDSSSPRLTGQIESENLAARRGGETLRLKDPIRLQVRLGVDESGPFAEEFIAQAPFIRLNASGRLAQGQLQCESDLTRLTNELGQFLDLGSIRLEGYIQGQANWRTTADQDWQIGGNFDAEDLRVSGLTSEAWIDQHVQLKFDAAGRLNGLQLDRVDSATLECRADSDEMVVRVSAPTTGSSEQLIYPVSVRLIGDLARWRSRVAWASPQVLPRVSGQVDVQAKSHFGRDSIGFDPVHVSIQDFELVTPQQTIVEPSIEFSARGEYLLGESQLVCTAATLASTSISLKADSLRYSAGPTTSVDGVIQFRADLEKLWRRVAPTAKSRPLGHWTGQARLAATAAGASIQTTNRIDRFQWQQRVVPTAQRGAGGFLTIWHEPSIQLDVSADWPREDGSVQIGEARCQTETFDVRLAGKAYPGDRFRVDVQGTSSLNLDNLMMRLRPWLGPNLQISGSVARPFQLQGPLLPVAADRRAAVRLTGQGRRVQPTLVPAELAGEFGMGWQQVSAYGIAAGAGSFTARMRDQSIRVEPFQVPVSQGQLSLAPQIELVPPYRVRLEKGPVIERVNITPEMCQSWLKYVAPLVADATSAEGLFSIRVARAEIPLQNPREASIGGSLNIHQAHLGPGPLTDKFLTLAQTVRTLVDAGGRSRGSLSPKSRWVNLPEQSVPFRVGDGRVVHQRLTMQIGEVTIRTRGWVSFDQRLGLVAEIPVLDRWVVRQPYLKGLRGQTLKIPVRGTLQEPILDQRALQSIVQKTARGAAEGFLQQELQRQLKGLLPAK